MTQFNIRKASRRGIYGRIALMGPTGSGKSWTALMIAKALTRNGKILAIDTERGSLDNYADILGPGGFDKLELNSFRPSEYTDAILYGVSMGYDTIDIDSLSHAWVGQGGMLEQVDLSTKRSGSSNPFTSGWREMTPEHNKLVDTLLTVPAHIIVTMRSKMEYVLEEDERGKKVPKKVGLAPVQRQDMEYEFSAVCDLSVDHTLVVTKTRYGGIDGDVIRKPDIEWAKKIRAWLDGNEPDVGSLDLYLKEVGRLMKEKNLALSNLEAAGYPNPRTLNQEELIRLIQWLKESNGPQG